MKSLEDFININLEEFSELGCSEIIHCTLDEFDFKEVEYLKLNYRFDYKNICLCYHSNDRGDEIWIENMN